MAKKLAPVHPGEVLREEFMKPLKLTPYAIASKLGVPRTRIERVAREETPVTADTALRLGKFFGTPPEQSPSGPDRGVGMELSRRSIDVIPP